MKKLYILFFVLLICIVSYGQETSNVTRFLGIPIDGTKSEMVNKLKEKGFSSVPGFDGMLEGEFNGKNVYVVVQTNNRKVWRIAVMNKNKCDEAQIKINFNNLCYQFDNNSKYLGLGDQMIPESEDISYEMTVNNKQYQASYYQKLNVEGDTPSSMSNRLVWFTINGTYGEYNIYLYYENRYNMANGEDL